MDASHRQIKDEEARELLLLRPSRWLGPQVTKEADAKLIELERGRKRAKATVDNAKR